MFAPSVGTMMDGEHAFATSGVPPGDDDRDVFVPFVGLDGGGGCASSFLWTQRAARAEATNDAPRSQMTNVAGDPGTEFFAMSEDSDVVGGGLPPSLVDVRRQGRVLQRTVEQIVDPVPLVPMLHDVVPQMVEQLVDLLAPLDFRVAELVIEVPKIVCALRAARTVVGVPQMVEQLVEVPTVLSFSSLQQLTAADR